MRSVTLGLIIFLTSATMPVAPLIAQEATSPHQLPRPAIAAPANWVKPLPIPAPPTQAGAAATIILLNDNQIQMTAEGDTFYFATAYKIASASGLGEASLQVNWDPSLETLTFHHYRILRDGKPIDLLGDGSKLTVVRREKRMEMASLDGELTAAMQPEDLRVGDIIDLAYSIKRRDPALAGRSETLVGPANGVAFGRYRLRITWPTSKTMRWRAYPGIVAPKQSRSAEGNELIADLTDTLSSRPPQGAPSRFQLINAVEVTEFPNWTSVSSTLAPLYVTAETLNAQSQVKELAAKIAASTNDPVKRTEQALKIVQEQVRYLFLGMNDGGYVPAAADVTWSRRFGDCKGKTVLLVALLKELGVDARPVLVNTQNGDLVATRMAMVSAFDHVIVQARIAGQTYWLDGTRLGDTDLTRLEIPSYGVGLPVVSGGAELVSFSPPAYTLPNNIISLNLDASEGITLPATAVAETRYRGKLATDMRVQYSDLSAAELDRQLRAYWQDVYDFITPTAVKTEDDPKTGDFILKMSGSAKMDWFEDVGTRWYEADRARVGWKFSTDREGQLNKDAPFAFDFPEFWERRETIKLPNGGEGFRLQGEALDKTIDGLYTFHREISLDKGVMTMVANTKALGSELPAAKAEQVRSDMQALNNKGLFIRVPENYLQTDKEIAALSNDKKAQATAYIARGAYRFDKGEVDASLSDINAALAIDSGLAPAHAIRALALAVKGDPKADAAADRALAIDSKQLGAWRAKGVLAAKGSRFADAEKAYTNELVINPKDAALISSRGGARLGLGKYADSLADFDAALAIMPDLALHFPRAMALQGLGRKEEALAELDRAIAKAPRDVEPRAYRSELRQSRGDNQGAIEDLSTLIELNPKAEHYLKRATLWVPGTKDKASADVDAALKLEPKNMQALSYHASLAISDKKFTVAENDLIALVAQKADQGVINALRIELLTKQGKPSEALRIVDIEVAAKRPTEASALNQRCWLKATNNISLDTALADCEAAIKLTPQSAATLDSRAFVRLKMGDLDKAIADYDAALKIEPNMAASLFGRAIARAKRGERASALADLSSARKLTPDIDSRFAEYGVTVPDDPEFQIKK